jgi:hypothetical protein
MPSHARNIHGDPAERSYDLASCIPTRQGLGLVGRKRPRDQDTPPPRVLVSMGLRINGR